MHSKASNDTVRYLVSLEYHSVQLDNCCVGLDVDYFHASLPLVSI